MSATPLPPTEVPAPGTAPAGTPSPAPARMRCRLQTLLFAAVAIASGLCLRVAFPPFEGQAGLVWFAPIPFFLATRLLTPRRAAGFAFLGAFAFWVSALTWFWPLTDNGGPWPLVLLGAFGLSAFCAAWYALCAAGLSRLHAPWRRLRAQAREWDARYRAAKPDSPEEDEALDALAALRKRSIWLEIPSPVLAALLWGGSEYLRATFGGGFSWYTLGAALIDFRPLAQLASIGGVFFVSAFVALLADALAGVGLRIADTVLHTPGSTRRHLDLTLALVLLLIAFSCGLNLFKTRQSWWANPPADWNLRVAAVNPELPCIFTENQEEWDDAYARLFEQTQMSAPFDIDLIVWPETVLWAELPNARAEAVLTNITERLGVSLIFGCTDTLSADGTGLLPDPHEPRTLFRNAVWLMPAPSTNGPAQPVQTYAKRHLVPFGEYIPLDKTFPMLRRLAPAGVSCVPGKGPVLLQVRKPGLPVPVAVSPMICFEDTVPAVARSAAKGADLLVSVSNDAWFRGSIEAVQHHLEARYRAIENGLPFLRVSNAGVCAVVYPTGVTTDDLPGSYLCTPIPLPPATSSPRRTVYGWCGDWLFGIPAAVLLLAAVLVPARRRPR